ncbi:hypothetical protein [Exilibacterium tricleocarpae]|uniref:hypothetical protein n=1 Tax=Exilibacterium tricleocarpae TaxID=2591008 RepID=UPI0015D1410D|nr:hypothetical protein [Exilibacterium tricleocarpae]
MDLSGTICVDAAAAAAVKRKAVITTCAALIISKPVSYLPKTLPNHRLESIQKQVLFFFKEIKIYLAKQFFIYIIDFYRKLNIASTTQVVLPLEKRL